MANSKDFGVVNHHCEAFDNEGLFCIDSSAIPTSLGVNPSLTIAAVSERAAAALTKRGHELGLPEQPKGFRHGIPAVHVGERVIPRRRKHTHP
jgi:cholesterol oxidase